MITHFFQNTMLQSIERYMKQAIVDKNHAVSSAALVSSLVSIIVSKTVLLHSNTKPLKRPCHIHQKGSKCQNKHD